MSVRSVRCGAVWLPERRELHNAPTVLYTGLTFLYAQTVDGADAERGVSEMPDIEIVLRGFAAGALAAYLVFYGLRPGSPYPKWMLVAYDQPWVMLVALAAIVRIAMWDVFVGSMAFVGFAAFAADLVVFGAPMEDAAAAVREQEAEHAAGSDAGAAGFAGSVVGLAEWGATGADSGYGLARAKVAPGVEPTYSLYPMVDGVAGELLGGPAAF